MNPIRLTPDQASQIQGYEVGDEVSFVIDSQGDDGMVLSPAEGFGHEMSEQHSMGAPEAKPGAGGEKPAAVVAIMSRPKRKRPMAYG